MTPSDKPERTASTPEGDAEQVAVSTKTVDDTTSTASAEQDGAAAADGATGSSSAGSSTSSSGELDATDSPPPWQRPTLPRSGDGEPMNQQTQGAAPALDADTQAIPHSAVRAAAPTTPPTPSDDAATARTAVSFSGGPTARTSTSSSSTRRPSRGPRRASLQVKRVDPWSVLKLALVLSIALFFIWMIAVAVLYGVLDGMGVWDQLNGTFTELTQPNDAASEPLISAGRVFSVASIIGAINIVLITALATVAAFIYNVAADFAGGIEVTLSERE